MWLNFYFAFEGNKITGREIVKFSLATETIMYLLPPPSPLPPPPQKKKIVHSHYFQFLLGITVVAREIEDNGYAKFWGGKQGALWSR